MFTLNEVEIEFLRTLNIEAILNKFIDTAIEEEFKFTDAKEEDGNKKYTYSCGSKTIVIEINEHSCIGIKRTITVVKGDTKYVFYSEKNNASLASDRICVTIGEKDNFYGASRETIALSYNGYALESERENEDFMRVSIKNYFNDDFDTAFVSCSPSSISIRQCNSETPFTDRTKLTSENYEKYLELLMDYISNTKTKDEFIPFIKFVQSVVPLYFINGDIARINQYYDQRIDFENATYTRKLSKNANAKQSIIDKIHERKTNATRKINDERNERISKYVEVKKAFDSSYERKGRQIRVYRTDEFE